MEIVVSGIRPTGPLHLGNYFGAVKNFVKMQNQHKCFFFIADYHSLTTHPTPTNLNENVKSILVAYLACGINPDIATIYTQSSIPEIPELYLLLNMNAYLGELLRCTSFKEKARKQDNNVNAGLLTYPTLMAADILIHKATKVPVGKDQEQHLEMTRTFAKRFNNLYKVNFFPEPTAFNFDEKLIKIPGLDGSTKMGKSESNDNPIFLSDTPELIRKKVMRAVTDTGPTQKYQKKSQPIENLFTIMKIISKPDTYNFFEEQYNNCTIRYGDMKKQLAEDIIEFINPLREKIISFSSDEDYLKKVLKEGKDKARESAKNTIKTIRSIIGFHDL
ncbi:MAG TPA: tryptophan--tRNA ligase [Bacteroidales bacterium]|nr:tryptophan--tRNA ligase [Bacteroidales bacterium]